MPRQRNKRLVNWVLLAIAVSMAIAGLLRAGIFSKT